MLIREADWLGEVLVALPPKRLGPLLCVGSGTRHAREVQQAWIAQRVYRPLEERGVRLIHHEYAPGEGVDIAGDLLEPDVGERLRDAGARSVLCSNVLEHLADRGPAVRLLSSLVAPDGCLVVTVPRRFPYHPDPIDTMFRPSVLELAAEFPELELELGAEVEAGTLISYLRQTGSLRQSIVNGIRAAFGGPRSSPDAATARPGQARPSSAARITGTARYLVSQTSVTCAVLRRA